MILVTGKTWQKLNTCNDKIEIQCIFYACLTHTCILIFASKIDKLGVSGNPTFLNKWIFDHFIVILSSVQVSQNQNDHPLNQ